jgi:nicotinate-nucleotide pyrophosphorylase (carboxylating)
MDPYQHPDTAAIIRMALDEDLGTAGDLTCQALVPVGARLAATITAKGGGTLCGLALMGMTFAELAARGHPPVAIDQCAADGAVVAPGTVVWRAHGEARTLLIGERTGLNLAQRLSGTATLTSRYVALVAGTRAGIFDTRKTTPGLRHLQKHAVVSGAGRNHRLGLYDQVLIKDNHIALMGRPASGSAAAEAVRRCRAALGPGRVIEVEIEAVADLEPAMRAGADIILLDNLPPAELRLAVQLRDRLVAGGLRQVPLEASGGITLASVRAVAESGVERISTGELTHSAAVLDLSMRCQASA